MNVCLNCGIESRADAGGVCDTCGGPSVPMRESRAGDNFSGRLLGDKYVLLQPLGRGGMGHVYLAKHRALGKSVAIKIMNVAFNDHPDALRRFYAEARNAARLEHPHNCKVFDFGHEADGLAYIVMEVVRGKSLAHLRIPMPTRRALSIAAQVCCALQEAHDVGLVHRDLKPDNIMLSQVDGTDYVRVLDYGIAKFADSSTGLTNTGVIVGTPEYLSPEQATGERIDLRSDIYSLGVMLYEMVTGRLPFEAETVMGYAYAHIHHTPDRPSNITPLPPAVERLVLRCLAKDPADRPQSMDEVREAVEAILGGKLVVTPPPSDHDRATSPFLETLERAALVDSADFALDDTLETPDPSDLELETPTLKRRFAPPASWAMGAALVVGAVVGLGIWNPFSGAERPVESIEPPTSPVEQAAAVPPEAAPLPIESQTAPVEAVEPPLQPTSAGDLREGAVTAAIVNVHGATLAALGMASLQTLEGNDAVPAEVARERERDTRSERASRRHSSNDDAETTTEVAQESAPGPEGNENTPEEDEDSEVDDQRQRLRQMTESLAGP